MKLFVIAAAASLALTGLAHANSLCSNPDALQSARVQFSKSYGGTGQGDDLDAVQITNEQALGESNGVLVCGGTMTTPKMTTKVKWAVEYTAGDYNIEVIQAVDPYHFQSSAASPSARRPAYRPPVREGAVQRITKDPVGSILGTIFN